MASKIAPEPAIISDRGEPSTSRSLSVRDLREGDLVTFLSKTSGGNFIERYLYPHFCEGLQGASLN